MLYSNDKTELRKMYFNVWQKHQSSQALEPLEQQILQVILDHPEYQALLAQEENSQEMEFNPLVGDVNPFLHMGLHLAIRDQLALDMPKGIRSLFSAALNLYPDPLYVEHAMMEIFQTLLFDTLTNNKPFDNEQYLALINQQVLRKN